MIPRKHKKVRDIRDEITENQGSEILYSIKHRQKAKLSLSKIVTNKPSEAVIKHRNVQVLLARV